MKRIILAMTILALVLPAMKQVEARVDVSVDFFYDNIGSDGNWVEVADYGYCWQPSVAVSNSHWRPYSDGYWAYTDVGWTWVSNEDFGWATYHYGRWTRLRDRGWFWVPGREWGPAWVSWRTGGDYVGWAPLPPRGRGDVDDDRPISGQVDVDFDIGPDYYNFVDVRYIGEPVLRERIVQPSLNITYISNTVNVTNITYTNSVVYNHGPDYDTLSRYSTRPIRRMTLERDSNVELSVAAQARGLTRVQGDKIIVAAPLKFQKPPKPIAPKMVKEKIEKPTFEHGWNGVSDPKAQADLKQKMKSEDPKNIPPPNVKPHDNAGAGQTPAAASPAAPALGSTPAAAASPAVPANPATTAAPTSPVVKDKRLEKPSPVPAVAPVKPGPSPVMTPAEKPRKDRDEKPKPKQSPNSLATSPDGTPVRDTPAHDQDIKKDKRTEKAPDMMPPTRQPSAPPTEKMPRKPKDESTATAPNREAPPDSPAKQPKPKITSEPMPPTRETPPKPKVNMPSESMPPKREAPPEAPRKQPPSETQPKERTAPPSAPVKPEAPPSKQRPDKKNEPAPSPGA